MKGTRIEYLFPRLKMKLPEGKSARYASTQKLVSRGEQTIEKEIKKEGEVHRSRNYKISEFY